MSKFSIGDRVSFLYFGDMKKGTILAHWPVDSKDTGTGLFRVTIDGSVDSQVCVAEKTMRKLKPKKTRREFWVVWSKNNTDSVCFAEKEKAHRFIDGFSSLSNCVVIHVKEVRG